MKLQELLTGAQSKPVVTPVVAKILLGYFALPEPIDVALVDDKLVKKTSLVNPLAKAVLGDEFGIRKSAGKYKITPRELETKIRRTLTFGKINKIAKSLSTTNRRVLEKIGDSTHEIKSQTVSKPAKKTTKPAPKKQDQIIFSMTDSGISGSIELNGVQIALMQEYSITNYPENVEKLFTDLVGKANLTKLKSHLKSMPKRYDALFDQYGIYNWVGGEKKSKQRSFITLAIEEAVEFLSTITNVKADLAYDNYSYTKPKAKPKAEKTTSTITRADIEKDVQVEWNNDGDDRITHREAYSKALKKAQNELSKYIDFNKMVDDEEGDNYDPEWSDFAPEYKWSDFAPKSKYKDVIKYVRVSGRDDGDYSGDYAMAYYEVFFK